MLGAYISFDMTRSWAEACDCTLLKDIVNRAGTFDDPLLAPLKTYIFCLLLSVTFFLPLNTQSGMAQLDWV